MKEDIKPIGIVTITFSPCIDKSTAVASFTPEKKLHCRRSKLEAGGGGINVAKALKRLNINAISIFPAGGCTGKRLSQLLRQEQLNAVAIPTENETRENLIVVNEADSQQFRFIMPSEPLQEKVWQDCLDAAFAIQETGYVVVSGSFPPGFPPDIFKRLAALAKRKNACLCVDTSGDALKAAVEAGVYLLKPNLAELSMLSGLSEIAVDQVENLSRKLLFKHHIDIMVISMGANGAMLVTKNQCFKTSAPLVNTVSTSGAGDSMLAGIVYGLAKGDHLQQVLDFGVACGTAATLNQGTELFHLKDVALVLEKMKRNPNNRP